MALILHIDTATFNANICIAKDANILLYREGNEQKTIEFLHPTISEILEEKSVSFATLDAVMIHAGPGSYTGLRIGFSAAKGICYASKKSFLAASSFDILSYHYFQKNPQQQKLLIIDNARIDEWYFQYFENQNPIEEPCIKTTKEVRDFIVNIPPLNILSIHPIEKDIFEKEIQSLPITTKQMVALGEQLFSNQQFTDIYHSEPFYCKAAYVK